MRKICWNTVHHTVSSMASCTHHTTMRTRNDQSRDTCACSAAQLLSTIQQSASQQTYPTYHILNSNAWHVQGATPPFAYVQDAPSNAALELQCCCNNVLRCSVQLTPHAQLPDDLQTHAAYKHRQQQQQQHAPHLQSHIYGSTATKHTLFKCRKWQHCLAQPAAHWQGLGKY